MDPTRIIARAPQATVGDKFAVQMPNRVFQATVLGANAAAEVAIEVSANGVHFLELARITVADATGKGFATDGFNSSAPWPYVRASVVSVSAGAAVDVYIGV